MQLVGILQGHLSKTRRRPNAGLMLDNSLRRWPNITPALRRRLVFVGKGTIGDPQIAVITTPWWIPVRSGWIRINLCTGEPRVQCVQGNPCTLCTSEPCVHSVQGNHAYSVYRETPCILCTREPRVQSVQRSPVYNMYKRTPCTVFTDKPYVHCVRANPVHTVYTRTSCTVCTGETCIRCVQENSMYSVFRSFIPTCITNLINYAINKIYNLCYMMIYY